SSEVSDIKVQGSKNFQTLLFKIKNTGNVHLDGSGTVVLMDKAEKLVDKFEVKIPFLFPGQTRSVSASLTEKVPPGSYHALMSVVGVNGGSTFVKEFPVLVSK
ncbi:MAG: hypothetical protein R2877_08670, partial [Bdellovibrionota bacterium]